MSQQCYSSTLQYSERSQTPHWPLSPLFLLPELEPAQPALSYFVILALNRPVSFPQITHTTLDYEIMIFK